MPSSFIASDDWFMNVDLALDPAASRLQASERNDYITSTLAIYRLNSLDSVESKIDFRSDVWDFRPFLQRGEKAPNPVFHFEDVPEDMRLNLKFFIKYFRHKENLKVSTLYIRFTNIKSVFNKVYDNNPGVSFDGITTRMVLDEIESRHLISYTAHGYYYAISEFYDYLTRVCNIHLLVDLNKLREKDLKAVNVSKQDDRRLPNIPKEVAMAIRKRAVEVMNDEGAEYSHRVVACALIMLFNLGVRIDDLLDFRVDDLKKEATEVDGYKLSYITYFIHKLSRHGTQAFGHTIYASTECVMAFETLQRIRQSQAFSSGSDYLFGVGKRHLTKLKFGTSYYPVYMYLYHRDICATDNYSDVFTPNSSCYLAPVRGKTLYFPDTRQYRVWLCNDLYARGISWAFVEEHLKHLSHSMMNYYNRPEERSLEYIEFAENVFKTMLVENVSPIGVLGDQIRENINDFLKKKEFNLATDWDSIMDIIGDKVSIRAKMGGFCFKTSLVPCAQEKGTDTLLCAYNLCPNVYSFYYNVDHTYFEFRTHVEAFEQNCMKGLIHAAQKELVDIHGLIARSLKPQIKQLEEELKKMGFKSMAEEHPNVIDIVKDLSNIKKQIEEWASKKIDN